MTNTTAPRPVQRSGAVWIFAIGALALAGQVGHRLGTDLVAGVAMCIPMALAVAAMARSHRAQGRVSVGSLWFAFGAAFPAVAGVARIAGVDAANVMPFVMPVGFLAIGALMYASGVAGGCAGRRRRERAFAPTPSPAEHPYQRPGHVGTD